MTRKGTDSGNDDDLLDELRLLANEVDPVPTEVTSFANAALQWRRTDAELAEVRSDSLLSPAFALARSGASRTRSVTFHAPELDIDVEVRDQESGAIMLGQLAPPATASIEAECGDGTITATVEADALGRFRIELAKRGRIRLRVRRESQPPVETSWISI